MVDGDKKLTIIEDVHINGKNKKNRLSWININDKIYDKLVEWLDKPYYVDNYYTNIEFLRL